MTTPVTTRTQLLLHCHGSKLSTRPSDVILRDAGEAFAWEVKNEKASRHSISQICWKIKTCSATTQTFSESRILWGSRKT